MYKLGLKLLLLTGFAFSLIGYASSESDFTAEIEKYASENRFMGVALVAKGSEIVYQQSFGFANLEWKVPHSPLSVFRIGSITKQFTSAAVLLLEEQGKLSTEDKLSEYFPQIPNTWKAITIRNLLTHTSGIPNYTSLPHYPLWKKTAGDPTIVLPAVKLLPLEFTPGTAHKYSNTGYLILGIIIEKVSGVDYETFIRNNISGPLGLGHTQYDDAETLVNNRTAGYSRKTNGNLVNSSFIDMHLPSSAGALISTAGDLHIWNEALFNGKLLSARSIERMTTPELDEYGLGLVINTVDGRLIYEHSGGIDGFSSALLYYPKSGVSIVVLSNIGEPITWPLARKLGSLVHTPKTGNN